jgi:hypothetical protein
MWAHYAQNHEGFVIEFDNRHPYFQIAQSLPKSYRNLTLQKVTYSTRRPVIRSLKDFEKPNWYLVKDKKWEYEQEWRMLRRFNEANSCLQHPDGTSNGDGLQQFVQRI